MKQPTTESTDPHYVPRKAGGWEEEDIIAWATGKKSLSKDKKDQPRLLSVIGPPGSGKTTYLRRLEERLNQEPRVFALYLDLSVVYAGTGGRSDVNKALHEVLRGLLETQAELRKEATLRELNYSYDDTVSFSGMLAETIWHLCRDNYRVVLLVDQVEDIPDGDWQYDIERNVILTVLYSNQDSSGTACTRVIIARRDEQKLHFDQLKWIDMAAHLEPLTDDQPAEQIRRHLDFLIKGGGDAFKQLCKYLGLDLANLPQVKEVKVDHILKVVTSGRGMISQRLGDKLTGNPLVDLRLLYQSFQNDDDNKIAGDELNKALEAYWQKVGIADAKYEKLRKVLLKLATTNSDVILQRLGGKLTGNPLMNLQLLYQLFLKDGDAPITADELSIVLETYWRRAGLADAEHAELRNVLLTMAKGWGEEDNWNPSQWSQVDYARLHSKGRLPFSMEALAPAFEAGVIMMSEITRRYQLDPTLISLANGLSKEQTPGPGGETIS